MKIYTKKGDKGETSLIGGVRVPKHHIRIESYGTVDELNSNIGMVRTGVKDEMNSKVLAEIQDRLFTIGSLLASAPESNMIVPDLHESDITLLENTIDAMNTELQDLKSFILPAGSIEISYCHIVRCVCRRAERLVVLLNENEEVHPLIIPYLNRLSDYFFVLARYVGFKLNVLEVAWKPRI